MKAFVGTLAQCEAEQEKDRSMRGLPRCDSPRWGRAEFFGRGHPLCLCKDGDNPNLSCPYITLEHAAPMPLKDGSYAYQDEKGKEVAEEEIDKGTLTISGKEEEENGTTPADGR